jgi:hypothetical protein
LASTKTKKFGLFLASSEIEENGFFWYDSEPEMYEDIAKNFCKLYFDTEDVNRQNDFLKNFDGIVRSIKKSGLFSSQILERIKSLLIEFKIKTPFYDLENSYIGPGLNLWISQDLFPMQLRGTFRSSLYGFYLENNVDLGRAPIEFKETIRFEEFLEGPIPLKK